jgi:hypothetical protein
VTEQQLLKIAWRRLAILRHAEEISGNVALTCRYVWRILKRLELNRLPASQRHKRHDRRLAAL